MLGASVVKLRAVLVLVSCYACLAPSWLCAVGGKPTWLLSPMDGQLEAVGQDNGSVKDDIVKPKQDLAAAQQAGNKENERVLLDLLLSLNNQLLSLNEQKTILLRRPAPSKHAFSLYMLAYPCSHHVALHLVLHIQLPVILSSPDFIATLTLAIC